MYATDRDGHVYSKEYYKDDNGEKHYLTDEGGALHFYDDQTDNYTQKNYQLLFNHNFTSQWNLNIETCLKEVLKCLWQEKPTLQDISLIFMLVFVSKQIFLCIVFLIFSVWS